MKMLWFFVAVIAIAVVGCEKSPVETKTSSVMVCDVANPLTDLPWLKAEVDTTVLLFQESGRPHMSIYECVYGNNEIGFLVDCGNVGYFRNCSGELLCLMGGFVGETCPELNIVDRKLIWTTDTLSVTIFCNFEDPLTDLHWLTPFIDSYLESPHVSLPLKIYQCTYRNGIGFLCEMGNNGCMLRSCHGSGLCYLGDEYCAEYNIDFENKQLIYSSN